MEFTAQREVLVRAGKELLSKGLVARTWGNLSIRLDAERFLITPSGRNYETLAPEDLAIVRLEDLSWEGLLKPSSEKELHARVYRNRSDVGAVVHTHQPAASSLSAARKGFTVPAGKRTEGVQDEGADKMTALTGFGPGSSVPCVPYALPTTKKLAKAVEKTIGKKGEDIKALLLSNHGTVCFGVDIEQALLTAMELENAAEKVIIAGFRKRIGASESESEFGEDEEMIRSRALETFTGVPANKSLLDETAVEGLLDTIRKNLPGTVVSTTKTPYVLAASWRGGTVKPYLDDFAQLIGPSLPVAEIGNGNDEGRILKILKRRSAVLVQGLGCICIGESESDSRAVGLVAEKGCRAAVETAILGSGRRISPVESRMMRLIYLMKYSKKAA